MNEILQKRIEEASIEYTMRTRPMCIAGGAFADMAREINKNPAFIAGANYALQNQWISVDEALPEEEEKKVLVTHQYGCQVAAFYKDGAHAYWGVAKECPIGASITHWMPIPSLEGGEE